MRQPRLWHLIISGSAICQRSGSWLSAWNWEQTSLFLFSANPPGGEGIGERLQLLKLPERWYLVLKPAVDISTASLFSAAELTRNCPPITIEDFFSGRCGNVFEPIVRQRYPEVGQVLDWLYQYAQAESEGAKLTGTGSCVYMACDTQEWAQSVLKGIPQEWAGFIARGLNGSPLTKQLQKVRGF